MALSETFNENSQEASAGKSEHELRDFLVYALGLIFKWWWFLAICLALAGFAAYMLFKQVEPTYKSLSTLEVKQATENIFNVSSVEQITVNREFLETQISLLQSQALSRTVVESLGLQFKRGWVDQSLPVETRINIAANKVRSGLRTAPVGRSRLISISFTGKDPRIAADIVNTLASNFIDYNLSKSFDVNSSAREFIETRLNSTKKVLEDSERNLARFAESRKIIDFSNNGGGEGGNLSLSGTAIFALNDEYMDAQSETYKLKKMYEQVKSNPEFSVIANNPTISRYTSQLRELEAEYREKLKTKKPQFPDMVVLAQNIETLNGLIQAENQAIHMAAQETARLQFEQALILERSLGSRLDAMKGEIANERGNSIEYNILTREVETNRTQYKALLERLKDITVTDGITSNLISIIDPAQVPKRPVNPKRITYTAGAALSGLMIFALIVFLFEAIDDRVTGPQDVVKKLKSNVVGVVPVVSGDSSAIDELKKPNSVISESFSSSRANLLPLLTVPGKNALHVTSTRAREGKSLIVYALAKSFADIGKRTVIIDADMRKPAYQSSDEVEFGLGELLRSQEPIDARSLQNTKVDGLQIITCKRAEENPNILLTSLRFIELVDQAKEMFDIVIIDSPPVLGLADSPTIASIASYSIFVVECDQLRSAVIEASLNRLKSVRSHILGVMLNKYKVRSNHYMDYNYYSYGDNASNYGGEEKSGQSIAKVFGPKKRAKLDI